MTSTTLTVYIMRGLPHCGKSYTAVQLAGETGVVCETDAYFFLYVGTDPTTYDWSDKLLPEARQWNFNNFRKAILNRSTPVIVDRGAARDKITKDYVEYAIKHGYDVEIKEPDSWWWQKIRTLLEDKAANTQALIGWARRLANKSSDYHRVPLKDFLVLMKHWDNGLTIEDILNL